jgi:hypothetical protein
MDYAVGVHQAVNCGTGNIGKDERTTSRFDSLFKIGQRITEGFELACNFEFSIFPSDKTIRAFDHEFL